MAEVSLCVDISLTAWKAAGEQGGLSVRPIISQIESQSF